MYSELSPPLYLHDLGHCVPINFSETHFEQASSWAIVLIYISDFVILAKFQTYDFHISGLLGRLLATPSSFQTFTFWRAESRLTEFMTYKQACHVFMLAYWFHLYEQSLPMPIMGLIANKVVGKALKPPSTSPAPNHAKTWAERVNGKFATFLQETIGSDLSYMRT